MILEIRKSAEIRPRRFAQVGWNMGIVEQPGFPSSLGFPNLLLSFFHWKCRLFSAFIHRLRSPVKVNMTG